MPKNKKNQSPFPSKSKLEKRVKKLLNNKKAVKILGAITAIFLIGLILFLRELPSPTTLRKDIYPISTKILDRNGELLYEIYDDQNRTPIEIDDLPEHVVQATISIEDKNFFRHHGFDTQGIIRAAFSILSGQGLEGGSTITQQLVKVALLTPERTIERKIKEAILALATEILYTKNQILEMYLNHIPYGGTTYGIETASQLYFNKNAKDLNLAEASLLAGLPQAPTRYSPFNNPDAAKARQGQVLGRMVDEGFITQEQATEAENQELSLGQPFTNIKAPHFVMYIREQLEEKYDLKQIEQGGLVVTTTLDLELQEAAQASLSAEIENLERLRVSNGASLVTNPKTGEILAMIGSRNYFDEEIDGKVNVTTRLRQPGSSIKPLNYALGIETKTISASTMILDTPICFQVEGQADYCPKNYDNSYRGTVQVRYALGNSYNIPAVKILALNDTENFMQFAKKMGINSWGDPSQYGLSLTLGGGEVRITDMATAFGVFANKGTKVPLRSILKIETHRGDLLEEYKPEETAKIVDDWEDILPSIKNSEGDITKPLSPQTAFIISQILSDNGSRTAAFGPSSVLNVRGKTVSVKTGTTNNLRDNWTIGYTSNRLVATWVGNNDNTPMSYVASGITGASPIWHDIISYALLDIDAPNLEQPKDGIITALVCETSGIIPTGTSEEGCATRNEYFLENTIPTKSRIERKEVWINRDTKRPPTSEQEFENVELQEHLVGSDPFVNEYCLDCEPLPEEQEEPPTEILYVAGSFSFNED